MTPSARSRQPALPINLPPRGLSRDQSAEYVGVGTTLFDAMVDDGRMPPPRKVNGRAVWDLRELDVAFGRLPHDVRPRSTWQADDAPSKWANAKA